MKIAICDDLAQEREKLKESLSCFLKNSSVAEFENGNDLIEAHKKVKFDFIFLDILMPEINGIDTAAKIRESDTETPIVFVSTSEEFGVLSYRVLAFDYILKPIDKNRLHETLKRFTNKNRKSVILR
ncbi:MAG: response regulator [Oscillospiraceae bacterium]